MTGCMIYVIIHKVSSYMYINWVHQIHALESMFIHFKIQVGDSLYIGRQVDVKFELVEDNLLNLNLAAWITNTYAGLGRSTSFYV